MVDKDRIPLVVVDHRQLQASIEGSLAIPKPRGFVFDILLPFSQSSRLLGLLRKRRPVYEKLKCVHCLI
jgi:hypothetical protein